MSWSIYATGKAPAVLKKVEEQSAHINCAEPEATVANAACHAIKAAINAQDPATVIRVEASGSQSMDYETKAVRNDLSIKIQPIYPFAE